MCKRIIHLTLFVFVLGIIPAGTAGAADPSLQLWLQFEDNANDSSNYARSTFQEDAAVYIDGPVGRASDLGGNDRIDVTGWKGVTGTSAFTIACWINSGDGDGTIVGWGTGRGNNSEDIQFRTANSGTLRIGNGSGNIRMTTKVNDDEWHHIAVTVAENGTMSLDDVALYLDGFDDTNPSAGTIDGSAFNIPATGYDVRIGREYDDPVGTVERRWNGDLDDLRIYDRELSAAEIRVLAGLVAAIPTAPADEAVLANTYVTLEWMPGVFAAEPPAEGHEVFLSDSFEDVNAAAPAASQGLTSNNFYFKSPLDTGTVYYWRVNAVNDLHPDTPWQSEIRSFTVPDTTAWDPSPVDTATFIDPIVTLNWKPALGAILQEVYFGDSFEDVNAGTGDTFQGQQPGMEYTPTGLVKDTTYYWRIDTVTGAGTVTGPVWSFTTEPDMPITDDPNLVGYWKLDIDEPTATVAVDHSGYDNHGSLRGDAHFAAGYTDEAILLDGDGDYVNIDGYKGVLGTSSFSMFAWIKTSSTAQFNSVIGWGTGAGARFNFRLDTANATDYSVRYSNGNGNVQGNTPLNNGEWHHIGLTVVGGYNADSQYVRIYTDGQDDTRESVDNTSDLDIVAGEDLGIGSRPNNAGSFFDGLIDEVRLYDRVLSPVEVARLMDPAKAVNPSPANGARDVPLTAKLTWLPGIDESTGNLYTRHNVYFSTNFEDVNAGTVTPIPVTGGVTEVTPSLDYYNYYYWRVDGINAADQANRGFIWDFKAIYDPAQIVDANLVAWYKFDGDATDSSGYGRDLTVMDGPVAYVEGVEDQAIQLDGVDDWAIYEFPTGQWPAYTVTAWAKLDDLNVANYTSVFTSHGPTNTSGFQIDANTASDTYRFNNVGAEDGTFGPLAAEWVHLAVAYDGLRATLFYNGSYVETVYTTEGTFNQFAVSITRNRGGSRFDGLIDDVRVYDRELSDPEILKIMRGDLARAWNPKPGDGATGVETEPTLTWTPGDYAPGMNGHYVYFGPDDPCNLALILSTPQPQTPSSHSPGLLDLDRTYYWVVDEVNAAAPGGVDPGKIWKFTTADYVVIDDMEGYQPANAAGPPMYEIWVDGMGDCLGSGNGTGANLFTDSNGIGGSQAMRFDYDQDGMVLNPCFDPHVEGSRSLYYSKASTAIAGLPSGIGANWNAGGAKALSLQFYGRVGNATTESLWVQLSGASGPGTKVFYGTWAEEEDLEDVNEASWHEWFIDLADFGVDLNNVLGIAIGIGNEVSGPHTAAGTLHIDDIRLYVPRCLPLRAKGPADFDGSCVVDLGDLMIMTDDWALSSYDFTVAAPSDANLDAHYQFEDNLLDSTANARNANPVGTVSYAAGRLGTYALALDGTNYAVATGYKGVVGTQNRTTSAWIKTTGADVEAMMILNWGDNTTTNGTRWAMRVNLPDQAGTAGGFRADIDGGNIVGTTDLRDNEWHHVAAVLQSDGSPRIKDIAIYVDGFRETLTNRTGRDIDINTSSVNDVMIGEAYFSEDWAYTGLIDDLRIYSRALPHEEVAGLAELTVGATLTQPLRPLLSSPEDTNLFPDDAINFKDYATLLNVWLDEVLWP